MKPREIKAGTFLISKKGDRIREILHIGALTGFQGEYVFYVDEGTEASAACPQWPHGRRAA
jgi:hypothetical protein